MNSASEQLPALRTVCVSEADKNFYVAVKEPFEEDSEAYKRLDFLASRVCLLDEGSQVFVYSRRNSGHGSEHRAELMEDLQDVAEEVGGVALYPTVRPISEPSHA